MLALSLASTALALYLPYLTRELVDRALLGRDPAALRRVVGLFLAAGAASFLLNIVSGLRYTETSARILFDMRLELYEHLQRMSPRFYARMRLGEIMSRLNNDISEIQRVMGEAALAWVGNVLFLAGTVFMMAWLDAGLFLIAVLLVPLSVGALIVYRTRLEHRVRTVRERSADIGSFLVETLQAMRLIVGANAQEKERARFAGLNARFVTSLLGMQRLSYFAGGLPGLLLSAGSAAVFLYGGSRVIDGTLTLGTFAAFMAYQMRLMAPVQALMGLYTSIATARVSWRRVAELLEMRPDVEERTGALPLEAVRGHVAVEDVTFAFDRGAPVLDRVSFEVRPGEVVAVVGVSGAGKSTIADLVARFVDPDSGRVRLDGHDLRDVRLADVRRQVLVAEQAPVLFHASIAENIRYGLPDASDEAVRDAARAAGLHDVIAGWPEGYGTVVGERGLALSVGERQRVALARAFLARPAVLILDEPTAALDAATARVVTDSLRRLRRGLTTIVITHREELARSLDRVISIGAAVAGGEAGSERIREGDDEPGDTRQPVASRPGPGR